MTHPWLERATAWCWARMERPVDEAHSLSTMLVFLRHAPDRERAAALGTKVAQQASGARFVQMQPGGPGYGLTPLQLVPAPDAPGRAAFSDAQISAHLDHLLGQQQEDGGWPVSWSPPGAGALQEWRGIVTLDALRTLRAYGRI